MRSFVYLETRFKSLFREICFMSVTSARKLLLTEMRNRYRASIVQRCGKLFVCREDEGIFEGNVAWK